MKAIQIIKILEKAGDKQRAKALMRFFKTGPGQYGEGDVFIGLTMPQIRVFAKQYQALDLVEVEKLLESKYHEARMLALVILTLQFPRATTQTQKQIFNFYVSHTQYINNWDLVDVTTPRIVGAYLYKTGDRKILYKFAKSKNLWERRIAIIATQYFIQEKDFEDTLKIAELLLQDKHDLIHKAVGWMLREVGKRDQKVLISFLDTHAKTMPRTMLRYALEKLSEKDRKHYMHL